MIFDSKTFTISINCEPEEVYNFVSNPNNLPQWANAFCKAVRRSDSDWIIETPQGPRKVRFVAPNDFGIVDHYVSPAPGLEIYVPMRVVANGTGSEVIFTLFRLSEMPDEKFVEDIELVKSDLQTLKRLLEDK